MTALRLRALALGLLLALACGCATLPVSGEVHTDPGRAGSSADQVPYFAPPGPGRGDTPEEVVRGFLLAMQANPPSTAVARGFLSARAKATWRPSQSTIVYDVATVSTAGGEVLARLRDAHELSPEGVWLDGTDASTTTVPLTLVQQGGEWRIDNPPNALVVPASYFANLFAPFELYWFDRTGSALVPTRVYVPRGEETATNLVRGLLAGPPPAQRAVAVSAFPEQATLDFAVVVDDAGIAEVPLGASVLKLAPADLNRLVVQLTHTLRQVPGINRLRITVNGVAVPLADGRTDISVTDGSTEDPLAPPLPGLLAISAGRVLRDDGNRGEPVGGPFGGGGYALRSLAWRPESHEIAAVSGNGRRVFVAPDRGGRAPSRVRAVLDGASNVLRPAYDRFDGLWLVDRTPSGAVVHLLRAGHDRVIPVPGISGAPISSFTVTRDGTALVAVRADGTNPTIEVSSLVRQPTGRLLRALPARTLQVTGVDLGPARDVGQNGATTVAVLTRPSSGPDQIVSVELDGSPGVQLSEDQGAPPRAAPGAANWLVVSSDPADALRVVDTDRRLFSYSDTGSWTRSGLPAVVAAAYAQ